MITGNRPRGYRIIETLRGDTLQAIAARALNDAGRWPELAALNNLVPPYIVDSIAELENETIGRVLISGQQLKVPAPARRANAATDDIYGTDILLDRGQLTADPETGDFATISDAPNLAQAIRHRVETHLGELQWHQTYGCGVWRLLGHQANGARNQLAAAMVGRALRSDPRVTRAENVRATISGDVLSTEGIVIATDGKSLPIALGDEGE